MALSKTVGNDMTTGPILKKTIQFTLPVVAANLLQQLYSIVDLMVIGWFVGNTGTVGVNSGSEFTDLLLPLATGFSGAIQVYISQLFGAKKDEERKKAIGTALFVMAVLSVVLAVGVIVFRVPLLRLINCPDEAFDQAKIYLLITMAGLPFIFGYNAICGVLRGMGESKRPLIFVALATGVNIVLDIVLVAAFGLSSAGTAIATLASQITSFLAALIFMLKNQDEIGFSFKLKELAFDRTSAHIIFIKLGLPMALRSFLVRLSLLWVNAHINAFGLIVSATNAVGNKITKVFEVFSTSICDTGSGVVGQNIGAKKIDRAKKAVYSAFLLNVICAIVIVTILWTVPEFLFGLFTSDHEVIKMGVDYLHIISVFFILAAFVCGFQTVVIGTGNAVLNFAVGIIDGVVCKIGLSLIFNNVFHIGAYSYFWATSLSRLIPAFIVVIYFYSGRWKKRSLLKD